MNDLLQLSIALPLRADSTNRQFAVCRHGVIGDSSPRPVLTALSSVSRPYFAVAATKGKPYFAVAATKGKPYSVSFTTTLRELRSAGEGQAKVHE